MELLVIEVLGVPQVPPHDRMVDQLKIHFLKQRNSGGDVLMVIYPTSTPGQAYVIFESAKGLDTHSLFGKRLREQCLKPLDHRLVFSFVISSWNFGVDSFFGRKQHILSNTCKES